MTLLPPAGGDETVRRLTLWPGWCCCGLLALVFAFDPDVSRRLQLVPLVVSVVLVGLPHGAIDHLVPSRLAAVSTGARRAPRRAGVSPWVLATRSCGSSRRSSASSPSSSSHSHMGAGDMHALVAFAGGNHLVSLPQRALAAVVRGGFPMLVPSGGVPDRVRARGRTARRPLRR
ncbi:MAG: hypothetical protein U5K28_08620 [Halobacteriales archaeon]|nr:hypothetical protein [Halobacteriales archaeon]